MPTRPFVPVLLSVLLVAAPAAPLRAETVATPPSEARQHHARGIRAYDIREFGTAIAEFKRAYELSSAPPLLFNLAQAHRLKGDDEKALYFYERYLQALPAAPNRADAESRISELRARLARRAPLEPAPAPGPVAASDAGEQVTPGRLITGGAVVGGLGVALLATGLYFGIRSHQAHQDLVSLNSQRAEWSPSYLSTLQQGERSAITATALYAAGGAAVATGVVLLAVGLRRRSLLRRVAIAPQVGGAQLVMGWGF